MCNDIVDKYADRFKGVGNLVSKEIKLHIDKNVSPVAETHRRIPFNMRKKVEEENERLQREDIIEKSSGPTPWVSPIVCAPKEHGQIRLCVDMR